MKTQKTIRHRMGKLPHTARSLALPIFVALTQGVVLYLQPFRPSGDDPIRIQAVLDFVSGRLPLIKFSLIHPSFFALLEKTLQHFGAAGWSIKHNGVILWALWSSIIISVLRRYRSSRYIASVLVLVFTSMLTPYLLGFNAEAFSALGVSGGLAMALLARSRWARMIGWILAIFSTANIPVTLVGAIAVSLYLVAREKRLRYLAYPLAVLVVIVLEASVVRGSIALSKYGIANESGIWPLLPWERTFGFGFPIFFGVLAILFSFGRGLLFYMPTVLTNLRRQPADIGQWLTAQLLFVAALVPVYGSWWAWYGGLTYGPRFFMLGTIVGGIGLTELIRHKGGEYGIGKTFGLVFLAAYSAWIAIIGVAYFITPKVATMCMQNGFIYEPFCWYSPEYSTIFAPIWEGGAVTVESKVFTFFAATTVLLVCLPLLRRLWRLSVQTLISVFNSVKTAQWKL